MSAALPPHHHPPLLEVTPTDHCAWVAIATTLGLCCALVTLLLRAFVRVVISPPFGHDDTTILAATVVATIQSSVVLYAVSKGLGRAVDLVSPDDLQAIEKAFYAADLLYLLAAYLSKCSIMFLLLRLTPSRQHRQAFNLTLVILTAWLFASVFAIALRCDLSHPWSIYQEKCTALLLRWQIVVALDIITEALIFGMSYYLVHGLHMSTKNKFIVLGSFGFRLAVIPFLIIRLVSYPHHHLSTNPTFVLTHFSVWTQTTLYVSLMVSTIPCLKPFVAGLNTGYGAFDTEHVATQAYASYGSNGYASRQRRGRGSNILSSKSGTGFDEESSGFGGDRNRKKRAMANEGAGTNTSGHHGRTSPAVANDLDARLAGQEEEHGKGKATTHAMAVAQDGNSIGSNDSQQMIIRKDVAWKVEYSTP